MPPRSIDTGNAVVSVSIGSDQQSAIRSKEPAQLGGFSQVVDSDPKGWVQEQLCDCLPEAPSRQPLGTRSSLGEQRVLPGAILDREFLGFD